MTTGYSDDLVPATKLDVDKGRDNALPTIVVEAKDELLHKQFGFFAALGLAFVILNSWAATAATLNLAIISGGPVAVIWGELAAGLGNLAIAASLAELCSIWPTAGGQYHWVHLLAEAEGNTWKRGLSYANGWVSVLGWWTLYAGATSLPVNLLFNTLTMNDPTFSPQKWQFFLVFLAFITITGSLNVFFTRALHTVDRIGLIWSFLAGIAALVTTVALAGKGEGYQGPSFVFTTFYNETGWNPFVAFMLGMLQAAFGLIGCDAVSHLVEEMPHPSRDAPRVIVGAVIIGVSSAFVFVMALLFCITDVAEVETSLAGPLATIFLQASGSKTGATILMMLPLICSAVASQGVLTTASRMTWALACDGALPFSGYLRRVSERLNTPLFSIAWCWIFAFVLSLLYLGSTSTFNAMLSSAVIALTLSYCFPIIQLTINRRRQIAHLKAPFSLGRVFGPICNIVALIYGLVMSVFFTFPPTLPATGTNMNYVSAVLGIVGIIAIINWFAYSKKVYRGPINVQDELDRARVTEIVNSKDDA